MAVKPTPAIDRVMRRVTVSDVGCWLFTGAIDPTTGYGRVGVGPRGTGTVATHRVTYADHWGEISPGQHIDHLCRNRACCNPLHLEAVTQAINNQRSWDARRGLMRWFADQYATPSNAYQGAPA